METEIKKKEQTMMCAENLKINEMRDYRTAIKRSTHKSTWLRGSLKIFYMRQRSSSVNCFLLT